MIFKENISIDPSLDIILPFRKGQLDLDQIHSFSNVRNPDFEGAFSEYQTLYKENGSRVYLLGMGEEKDIPRLSETFRKFAFKTGKFWSEKIQLDCRHLGEGDVLQAILGLEMASYKIGAYKSEDKEIPKPGSTIYLVSEQDNSRITFEGQATGDTINRIKSLVDAPSNIKTPEYLSDWAAESAKKFDYECKILDQNTLEKEGFDAVLAVGKGSIHKSCIIVNSYLPKKGKNIDIGLVGKGITFDTGGLSIKPSQNLHYMKSDMGGAAAVLGAVELIARLKLNVNVVGVVAAAENAVDANSFKPGDVIGSYSGKTIEIIDTDAEGRLVLADALNYIVRHHKPVQLIDLATLTGSVVRTLGYSAAGMFTSNKEMSGNLTEAGSKVHERVWPLPMFDDFEEDLQSDIADIRNFSGKPVAGAITAAKFLEVFTQSHEKWVHLDIAGVAFGSSDYAKMKSSTGFGVRLLVEYIKSIIK